MFFWKFFAVGARSCRHCPTVRPQLLTTVFGAGADVVVDGGGAVVVVDVVGGGGEPVVVVDVVGAGAAAGTPMAMPSAIARTNFTIGNLRSISDN